jgi:hypothetical protein
MPSQRWTFAVAVLFLGSAWSGGVLGNDAASKIPLARFRVLAVGTVYDNGN